MADMFFSKNECGGERRACTQTVCAGTTGLGGPEAAVPAAGPWLARFGSRLVKAKAGPAR